MDGPAYGILIVCVTISVALAVFSWWMSKRVKEAGKWPVAEATIQSAEIAKAGSGSNAPDLPCFAFSYVVDGKHHAGRFALRAEGDRGDKLMTQMAGKSMTIRYHPKRPQEWYIPVDKIGGCEVLQNFSSSIDPLHPMD